MIPPYKRPRAYPGTLSPVATVSSTLAGSIVTAGVPADVVAAGSTVDAGVAVPLSGDTVGKDAPPSVVASTAGDFELAFGAVVVPPMDGDV